MQSATVAHLLRTSIDDRLSSYSRSRAASTVSVSDASSLGRTSRRSSSASSKPRWFDALFGREPSVQHKNKSAEVEVRYMTLQAMVINA